MDNKCQKILSLIRRTFIKIFSKAHPVFHCLYPPTIELHNNWVRVGVHCDKIGICLHKHGSSCYHDSVAQNGWSLDPWELLMTIHSFILIIILELHCWIRFIIILNILNPEFISGFRKSFWDYLHVTPSVFVSGVMILLRNLLDSWIKPLNSYRTLPITKLLHNHCQWSTAVIAWFWWGEPANVFILCRPNQEREM